MHLLDQVATAIGGKAAILEICFGLQEARCMHEMQASVHALRDHRNFMR